MLGEVGEVVYSVRGNAGKLLAGRSHQSEGESLTSYCIGYSLEGHMGLEQLKMFHVIGDSIIRRHSWNFKLGWQRITLYPLRKRQIRALKRTLYHRGLSFHLLGHGPAFVF